jgi:hypothetical protein
MSGATSALGCPTAMLAVGTEPRRRAYHSSLNSSGSPFPHSFAIGKAHDPYSVEFATVSQVENDLNEVLARHAVHLDSTAGEVESAGVTRTRAKLAPARINEANRAAAMRTRAVKRNDVSFSAYPMLCCPT